MRECSSNNEECCCPCHSKRDECHHGEDKHEMVTDYFLEAADCAWGEVLKDKIKEYILATQSDRMTELAKIVAEGNNQRWKNKMEKKHGCADFHERLRSFFSHPKK
jgi:hypothetical protein